jgi:tRNA(fMet)-specific endonuclease VapC
VTLGELLYGAARITNVELAERVRAQVLAAQRVLPFDESAAEMYGPLRARLERDGKRLDDADLMIASIALSRDLTLVTGNVRHFSRVPDLRVENWLADA